MTTPPTSPPTSSHSVPFLLKKEPPRFDIETDRESFLDWCDKWSAFERLSGISAISDAPTKKQIRLDALHDALSYATLRVIRNLPLTASEKQDVDKILEKLKSHIQGSVNTIVWTRQFFLRRQRPNETISEWLIDLIDIASKCNFADCCVKCEKFRIRDQLVIGANDENVVKKLLAVGSSLTLEQAISICESEEAALRDKQSLNVSSHVCAIKTQNKSNYSAKPKSSYQKQPKTSSQCCQWCGGPSWHSQDRQKCPAHDKLCKKCNKKGHFIKMCRSKDAKMNASRSDQRISVLIASTNDTITDPTPLVRIRINGQKFEAMPDSGANIDALGPDSLQKLGFTQGDLQTSTSQKTLAANGSFFESLGILPATITFGSESVQTTFHVLSELKSRPIILNWKTCVDLRILPADFPQQQVCNAVIGPTCRAVIGSKHDSREDHATLSNSVKPSNCECDVTLQSQTACDNVTSQRSMKKETMDTDANRLRETYADVFSPEIKTMEGERFKIMLSSNAIPHSVSTPRRVPLPLMEKLRCELDDLEASGIIKQITSPTEWCAPIVVASKKDSAKIRLCIDFRQLNQYVKRERYVSPTPHELISNARLEDCRFFTVVDARKGYHQIPLDEESQQFTTFITPFGRYCYLKAPYGISSISEHFNRRMDEALRDLPRVHHIVDDILVASTSWQQHVEDVNRLFQRLRERRITLNADKFTFGQDSVTFAGLRLSRGGFSMDPELLRAIRNFPTPQSKTDVRSFFGLVNQLSQHTNRITALLSPLQPLLKKDNLFTWDETHRNAFETVCRELSSNLSFVAYYDPSRNTRLHTDASRLNGLGFILRQQQPDGSWRVVQAGSRFITATEQRYAMIELELLAVAWACEKCRIFLEGLPHVDIVTDHKPLLPIMNSQALDQISNPRLQRLRMKIQRYNYTAQWVKGKDNQDADALSRYPITKPTQDEMVQTVGVVHAIKATDPTDLRLSEIHQVADSDKEYSDLKQMILNGFPSEKAQLPVHLRSYWHMHDKLSIDDDLVVCGKRLVIPLMLRKVVLNHLTRAHMGAAKTKARAREIVWWPNIDQQIEMSTKLCTPCQDNLNSHQKEPMTSRPVPTRAFQEVHADFCEFRGNQFLVVVDGYSGYPALYHFGSHASAHNLVNEMRRFFCETAVPERIFTDGGPQFTSSTFQSFLQRWDVQHTASSPHYPASNGRAEAAVKNIKKILRGNVRSDSTVDRDGIVEAILIFKNTPMYDGRVPSVMVFGRPIRDSLPAHRRNFDAAWQRSVEEMEAQAERVHQRVEERYNRTSKPLPRLHLGAPVAVQNPVTKTWTRHGRIVERMKNNDFLIKLVSGRILRRNRRFIRVRYPQLPPGSSDAGGMSVSTAPTETDTSAVTVAPAPATATPKRPDEQTRPRRNTAPPLRYIHEYS